MNLILASSSPRRRELLSQLDVPFDVTPSSVIERQPFPKEDAASYAMELALQKASDVAERHLPNFVLGADTIVVVDGTILGKPVDRDQATSMLQKLRGRSHHVITGVAAVGGGLRRTDCVEALVRMKRYSDDHVEKYVSTGEPMDKAGAYAVQGAGGSLVRSVDGCYNTVVGLPLCLVQDILEEWGIAIKCRPCRHYEFTLH